jgi:hypothetical protein
MYRKISLLFLAAAVAILSACTALPTATIPPSPQPLRVSYSPYLANIQDALHACATNLSGVALFFEQVPGALQDFVGYDLVIWWGESPGAMYSEYPLGDDELVVILNLENPKTALSQSELIGLFSGRIMRWTEIGTLDQDVSIWIFPEDNLLSQIFQQEVMGEQRFTRLASIAPSPQAMLEAIAATPGAIGFLPRSSFSPQVGLVEIDQDLQNRLQKPLLAVTDENPQSALPPLLACLQSGAGQAILAENYSLPE